MWYHLTTILQSTNASTYTGAVQSLLECDQATSYPLRYGWRHMMLKFKRVTQFLEYCYFTQ